MDETELEEFRAWKRAKDKSGFEEAFYRLEQTLLSPSSRQFNCVLPSMSYRVLGEALMALKKRLIED